MVKASKLGSCPMKERGNTKFSYYFPWPEPIRREKEVTTLLPSGVQYCQLGRNNSKNVFILFSMI
jgi:hypothetical protein